MNYNQFLHEAKITLDLPTNEEVLNVTRAFLLTLTDHLAGNAADNLAAQLPAELRAIIHEIGPEDRGQGQRFHLPEFYRRVADRTDADDALGEHYTRLFMPLFARLITEGELSKIQKVLSDDYAPLFADLHPAQNSPQ